VDNLYDAVIVGGGPAGLTAAIYLARARYRVLVVEKDQIGGQITITAEVVNYPGIERASGEQITSVMRQQADNFGTEFLSAEVTGFDLDGPIKTVRTSAGELKTFGIILAPGAQPKPVGFRGEEEFKGHGVAYCATCDGEFFTGLDVFVVGGGHSAADEAVFLTTYARHITILVRDDVFHCPRSMVERLEQNPKITIRYHTELDELTGDSVPRAARIRDTHDNTATDYQPPAGETFGVFVFVGFTPATGFLGDLVELDADGYIVTDDNLKTRWDGVYAAGDVRPKPLRQMITAASDGAIAATELERHIAAMRDQTGQVPQPAELARSSGGAKDLAGDAGVAAATSSASAGSGRFTPEIRAQLEGLFTTMAAPLELRATLDDRPVSAELKEFLTGLVALSDNLSLTTETDSVGFAPSVAVWRDGQPTGIAFHGVPGGHEFNSFVIGLYNAAGPGQPLDEATQARIAAIDTPTAIKVFVSLSCTMCPTTVMAAQQIAANNSLVTAEAFDLNHFPQLRQEYSVMSVPCLIVNDDKQVHFGKMNVAQVLDALGR
jgi:thioredoxin reductase (NADPH)